MPILFYNFFLCNFNLRKFRDNNEYIIRDIAIKKYIDTSSIFTLFGIIRAMLKKNQYGKQLSIDVKFPREKLVTIMKPYLKLYMTVTYSVDINKRYVANRRLDAGIKAFVKYNPCFGQKTLIKNTFHLPSSDNDCIVPFQGLMMIYAKKNQYTEIFNDKHIVFKDSEDYSDDYANSHSHVIEHDNYDISDIDEDLSDDDEEIPM
jgi:hypothetical protein